MNSNDVANASIATQHLDTVQVNISMLELKKDAQTIVKCNNNNDNDNDNDDNNNDNNNNNNDDNDKINNNFKKLSTTIVSAANASSTMPTRSIIKEYGNNDKDVIVMEDVKKLLDEILSEMK
ncbi:hypothetical protein QQG55_52795 [Brugia pahangi]